MFRDIWVIKADFNEQIRELLYNENGKESDWEIDDSNEDPHYILVDKESESKSDGNSVNDEPLLEDEDDIHCIVENYVLEEPYNEFFWGKDDSK